VSTRYQVVDIDLAAGPFVRTLTGAANTISSFTVIVYPAGGVSFLRIGQNGARIPVVLGMQWIYDPCEGGEREGLTWDQPAAGAGIAQIIIFTGGGALGT